VGLLGVMRRVDRRWWAPKFARRLAPRLLRDYGASKFYTAGQIRSACLKCRLPRRHLPLAYAAFLPQAEFDETTDLAARADYQTLRALFFRFTSRGEDFSLNSASVDFGGYGYSGLEGGGHMSDSSSGDTH
jgi:hypothetical protein